MNKNKQTLCIAFDFQFQCKKTKVVVSFCMQLNSCTCSCRYLKMQEYTYQCPCQPNSNTPIHEQKMHTHTHTHQCTHSDDLAREPSPCGSVLTPTDLERSWGLHPAGIYFPVGSGQWLCGRGTCHRALCWCPLTLGAGAVLVSSLPFPGRWSQGHPVLRQNLCRSTNIHRTRVWCTWIARSMVQSQEKYLICNACGLYTLLVVTIFKELIGSKKYYTSVWINFSTARTCMHNQNAAMVTYFTCCAKITVSHYGTTWAGKTCKLAGEIWEILFPSTSWMHSWSSFPSLHPLLIENVIKPYDIWNSHAVLQLNCAGVSRWYMQYVLNKTSQTHWTENLLAWPKQVAPLEYASI